MASLKKAGQLNLQSGMNYESFISAEMHFKLSGSLIKAFFLLNFNIHLRDSPGALS